MPGTMVITGASRGIGAATAVMAAGQGYAVCVNYASNADAAAEVVDRIVTGGGNAVAVQADVALESDVRALFDAAEEQLGPVTALINNAAIVARQSALVDIDVGRFERILRTNVVGAFNCAREAVKRMATDLGGAGGSIVNISSVAARTGAAFEYADYAASKGGLDSMTAGLAREVAPRGIRVNLVRPGFIHTDMHAAGGEPGRIDRLAPGIPLQRGGSPEEVARAVLWFCSEDAAYAVGSVLDVTGGV